MAKVGMTHEEAFRVHFMAHGKWAFTAGVTMANVDLAKLNLGPDFDWDRQWNLEGDAATEAQELSGYAMIATEDAFPGELPPRVSALYNLLSDAIEAALEEPTGEPNAVTMCKVVMRLHKAIMEHHNKEAAK